MELRAADGLLDGALLGDAVGPELGSECGEAYGLSTFTITLGWNGRSQPTKEQRYNMRKAIAMQRQSEKKVTKGTVVSIYIQRLSKRSRAAVNELERQP
jgi:hypothetical protein